MDMEAGELRPKYKMKGITLLEENTTDAKEQMITIVRQEI